MFAELRGHLLNLYATYLFRRKSINYIRIILQLIYFLCCYSLLFSKNLYVNNKNIVYMHVNSK